MLTVRFFAGAAEAAGTSSMQVTSSDAQTVGDVLGSIAKDNELLQGVFDLSTFLANGTRVDKETPAKGITELDVLPPFAGG